MASAIHASMSLGYDKQEDVVLKKETFLVLTFPKIRWLFGWNLCTAKEGVS